jgi:GTPase
MKLKKIINTISPKERTLLVGVEIRGKVKILPMDESLSELAFLAETAGLVVVGEVTQIRSAPNPKYLVGSGKIEEIEGFIDELDIGVVLFDDELSPRHQREIEKRISADVRILDRTAIILDIFAQRASTHEGSLQVELAQYVYRLPRLTRAWTHLARQAGGGAGRSGAGGVGLRGPGEKQLEIDKREIHRKMDFLKDELEKVRAHRGRHRARRKNSQLPLIALVGYTNAGKSTLLNELSNSDIYVADQLFATLDPTTRKITLPGNKPALVSDTVGFIQKLPTTLIAAFRATLEEISEADLLIHVLDISHKSADAHAAAVLETLEVIEANQIPILTVFNKIDLLESMERIFEIKKDFPDAISISAINGEGVKENLLPRIFSKLFESFAPLQINLPYKRGDLIALFHEYGNVESSINLRLGVTMKGTIPERFKLRFQEYLTYEFPKDLLLEGGV